MERWFDPIEPLVASSVVWSQLLRTLGQVFDGAKPVTRWYIEAHQFRILDYPTTGDPDAYSRLDKEIWPAYPKHLAVSVSVPNCRRNQRQRLNQR